MDFGQGRGERADPLERRFVGKTIVLGVLVVVAVAFALSAQRADPVHLPGVALDSPFLLDMERAVVAAALVVGAAVFLIRGWVGYFPSKLSTTGAEYGNWLRVDDASGSSESIREEVADLWAHQVAIARMMQAALDDLAGDEGPRDERSAHRTAPPGQEDML